MQKMKKKLKISWTKMQKNKYILGRNVFCDWEGVSPSNKNNKASDNWGFFFSPFFLLFSQKSGQ